MELVDAMVAGLADGRRPIAMARVQAIREVIAPAKAQPIALERLLARLEQAGFGEAVRSWRDSGKPRRIPPHHLHAVLGDAEVARMAGRAGMTGDELTCDLSEHLPAIVAQAIREGRLLGARRS